MMGTPPWLSHKSPATSSAAIQQGALLQPSITPSTPCKDKCTIAKEGKGSVFSPLRYGDDILQFFSCSVDLQQSESQGRKMRSGVLDR